MLFSEEDSESRSTLEKSRRSSEAGPTWIRRSFEQLHSETEKMRKKPVKTGGNGCNNRPFLTTLNPQISQSTGNLRDYTFHSQQKTGQEGETSFPHSGENTFPHSEENWMKSQTLPNNASSSMYSIDSIG